jgi:hypothetical protein
MPWFPIFMSDGTRMLVLGVHVDENREAAFI